MRRSKYLYLSLGFVAGVFYLVACGGGAKVGDAIGEISSEALMAVDVMYDNTASALASTNVQTAVDEVVNRITSIENGIAAVASSIVNATNVLYDNTTSKLAATNAQTAIDELAARSMTVTGLTKEQLVGTWSIVNPNSGGSNATGQITFNSDGSLSLDSGAFSATGMTLTVPPVGPTYEMSQDGKNLLISAAKITGMAGSNPESSMAYVYSIEAAGTKITFVGHNTSLTQKSVLTKQ